MDCSKTESLHPVEQTAAVNRWRTLVAGIFLMLCAGPIFAFGSLGGEFKAILGCSETEKQIIGVLGNVGLWTNIVGGFVFDHVGAKKTQIAGGLMQMVGFGGFYFSLGNQWPAIVAGLFWFLAGHGCGWVYLSTLFANKKNFAPNEWGFVVGVMACFFGCSATVLLAFLDGCIGGTYRDAVCEGGIMGGDVMTFVAILATVVPAIVVICAFNTSHRHHTPIPPHDNASARFNMILVVAMALILFICVVNLVSDYIDSVQVWANYLVMALLFLILLPMYGSTADVPPEPDDRVGAVVPSVDLDSMQAIQTLRFWALWVCFGLTVGADIGTLNFVSTMVSARGADDKLTHTCVVITLTCDSITRFWASYVTSRGVSSTKVLVLAPILVFVSQLLMLPQGTVTFICACAVMGVSDGIIWSITPLLTGKMFGLKSAGKNFGIVLLSAAFFVLLLMLGVEPAVYSRHTQVGEHECIGRACFMLTHVVAAVFGFVGTCIAVFLHLHLVSLSAPRREVPVSLTPLASQTQP